MKTIHLIRIVSTTILGVLTVGLLIFNFNVRSYDNSEVDHYSLKNIQALQASAYGFYCDQINSNLCTFGNWTTLGVLKIVW